MKCLTFGLLLGLAVASPGVAAHKLHYSLTELQWYPERGVLEVIHSLHLDDAMALLAGLGDPEGALDPRTQARLLLYTEQNFELRLGGQRLALDAVGAQIDGDYLWIYQERVMDDFPAQLDVACSLFQELSPAFLNQVNLRVGGEVRTLHFRAGPGRIHPPKHETRHAIQK